MEGEDAKGGNIFCKKIMLATGSSPRIWDLLKNIDHTIVPPVPSLFTFNIKDARINGLLGISVPNATVKVLANAEVRNSSQLLSASGPLLITHWGLSGPAVLKLSAWGARLLHETGYEFKIQVDWLSEGNTKSISEKLRAIAEANSKKQMGSFSPFGQIPKRLWEKFLEAADLSPTLHWAQLSKKKRLDLAAHLCEGKFQVKGKSTFKEEFVTAGGVDLPEVDMKKFASKIHPSLYMAGEVLNIDAITGGFNFQAAWTGGRLAGEAMAE